VSTLVHLATTYDLETPAAARRAHNVAGTQAVLRAAAAAGVERVVMITSTDVYGARPDNPVPLPDAAPLRAGPTWTRLPATTSRSSGWPRPAPSR